MKKAYIKPEIKGLKTIVHNQLMCASVYGPDNNCGFGRGHSRDGHRHHPHHPDDFWDEPCPPPYHPNKPMW